METVPQRQEPLEVPTSERTSAELVKRIRKLRWIGMEEEANRLQIALSGLPSEDCIFAEPPATDWSLSLRACGSDASLRHFLLICRTTPEASSRVLVSAKSAADR